MNYSDQYEAVIGLEVHAQLLTKSKLFCGDATDFGAAANTQSSIISLAHPGTLPKLNKKAVELAVKMGIALNCSIERKNYFARKNYFYPDLPKGFQTSQHTVPVCRGGYVTIHDEGVTKAISLNRIHIEEDAGKSIHDIEADFSCIDYNRAGVPLIEIVTEPCLHSAAEAFAFLTELRKLLRWLDVCDGNMEEGSMRCDANISVRLKGSKQLGTKVEVKNLNSIRNVKRAIDVEIERLTSILYRNETVIQETRSYNADTNTTFTLREKEEANDYRYFPEPDLPPFIITDDYINKVKASIFTLPEQLKQIFKNEYGLSEYDSSQLTSSKEIALFFLATAKETNNYKAIANWITGPIKQYLNENNLELNQQCLTCSQLASLIQLTEKGSVNFSQAAVRILPLLMKDNSIHPKQLAEELKLIQTNAKEEIETWVNAVLSSMPDKVSEYKKGKKGLIGLFVGEVKKISKGKADPKTVTELLQEKLNAS